MNDYSLDFCKDRPEHGKYCIITVRRRFKRWSEGDRHASRVAARAEEGSRAKLNITTTTIITTTMMDLDRDICNGFTLY